MQRDNAAAVLLFCVLAIACFAFLGSTDVVSMEGIVADGARHMLRNHEWAVPHLYGEMYAYKPPMAYWLTAASFALTGVENEWTLRLPVALTAFLSGWLTYLTLRRVLPRMTAACCVIASMTGLLALQKLQVAEFDMLLASGLMVATAAAAVQLARQRSTASLWLICHVGLAFALLAKGLPAIACYIPGLLLAAGLLRSWRMLCSWQHLLGVVVFVAIVGAWAGAAFVSEGPAAFDQIFEEASSRGLRWTWADVGLTLLKPIAAIVIMLPWSVALPACRVGIQEGLANQDSARLARTMLAFAASGTLVFMLTPVHNMRYLFPLCGPLGVLAGLGLALLPQVRSDRCRRHVRRMAVTFTALSAIGAIVATCLYPSRAVGHVSYGLVLGATVAAAVFAIWRMRRDGERSIALMLLAAAACLWAVDRCVVRPTRAESRSMRNAAAVFDQHIPADATVWVDTGDSYSSLFFYLGRPVRVFDSVGAPQRSVEYAVLTRPQLDAIALDCRPTVLARTEHRGRTLVLCHYFAETE